MIDLDEPFELSEEREEEAFLSEQILTYLGNKRSLLNFIGEGVARVKKRLHQDKLSTLDVFSGSGIVSRFFKQHSSQLRTNDWESYSAVINRCYLSNRSEVDEKALAELKKEIETYRQEKAREGLISELYAPQEDTKILPGERVFYTRRNALFLDGVRQALDVVVPEPLRDYFLAPLLAEASIHSNTSGVFKGFYKNKQGVGAFGGEGKNALSRILGEMELKLPLFSRFECEYQVFQEDAQSLISRIEEVDLAYLDPPYNQHPYGSNYFMLNLLVDYKRPEKMSSISGIPKGWKRSSYNKKALAQQALFTLVETCLAKFILLSYNSEGFVDYESFCRVLEKLGRLSALETSYQTFRGCRNLKNRPAKVVEFLFLLEKY